MFNQALTDLLKRDDAGVGQYRDILLSLNNSMQALNDLNSETSAAWDDHTAMLAAASGGTLDEYIAGYAERHRRHMAKWCEAVQHNGSSDADQLREDADGKLEAGDEEGVGR